MKRRILAITCVLAISVIACACGSTNNNTYHGMSQIWSEKTNESDRFGRDLQLNEDGTYYFGEVYDDTGKIILVSSGTWTSDNDKISFTPDEKLSALNVNTDNAYECEYSYDKKENSLSMTITMTDGENAYDEDIVFYGDGVKKKADTIQASGLLHTWISEDYMTSISFTQYADEADRYDLSVDTYDEAGELSTITGSVADFKEGSFTMIATDGNHHYAVDYAIDGDACTYIIDGKVIKTTK